MKTDKSFRPFPSGWDAEPPCSVRSLAPPAVCDRRSASPAFDLAFAEYQETGTERCPHPSGIAVAVCPCSIGGEC